MVKAISRERVRLKEGQDQDRSTRARGDRGKARVSSQASAQVALPEVPQEEPMDWADTVAEAERLERISK